MITSTAPELGSTVLATSGGGMSTTLIAGIVIVAIIVIAIAWVLTNKKGGAD